MHETYLQKLLKRSSRFWNNLAITRPVKRYGLVFFVFRYHENRLLHIGQMGTVWQ
jgi:hypothetical protein